MFHARLLDVLTNLPAADAIEELQGKLYLMKKTAEWLSEKIPRWISVEEALPEEFRLINGKRLLISTERNLICGRGTMAKEYIEREEAIKVVTENDYEGYATQAIKAIPAADVRSKWISVTERLPDGRDSVLALTEDCDIYVCDYIPSVKQFWTIPGDELHIDDITNWMPLPEPPKEET